MYYLGIIAWTLFISGRYITKLIQMFALKIEPLHPDKCGGLKVLGNLCFSLASPIFIGSAFFIGYLFKHLRMHHLSSQIYFTKGESNQVGAGESARTENPQWQHGRACARLDHHKDHGYMLATEPPSTRRFVPVIKEAASEARNTTAEATSSGVPGRPSSI
jgi:hypothetical protein